MSIFYRMDVYLYYRFWASNFFPAFSVGFFLLGFFQRFVEMMCIPKELGEKNFQPIYLPQHIFWNEWLNYQLVTTDTHKHTWYELDLLGFNLACA